MFEILKPKLMKSKGRSIYGTLQLVGKRERALLVLSTRTVAIIIESPTFCFSLDWLLQFCISSLTRNEVLASGLATRLLF